MVVAPPRVTIEASLLELMAPLEVPSTPDPMLECVAPTVVVPLSSDFTGCASAAAIAHGHWTGGGAAAAATVLPGSGHDRAGPDLRDG